MSSSPSRILAVGDLQGCRDALAHLLDAARFDPATDRLWLCGDLVNRGPDSLGSLRMAMSLGEAATVVLGNHDLHLLAVAAELRTVHRSDTLAEILQAPDRDALLHWLRHRPLAHLEAGHLLVHAGLPPGWSAHQACDEAARVEAALRGPAWRNFLHSMYGNRPDAWDAGLQGTDRLRYTVNALTRMRFVHADDGRLDFATKEGAGTAPPGLVPWFDAPRAQPAGATVVCGHWSTLGLLLRGDVIALDTGCVWGGKLSGVELGTRTLWQVACAQHRVPGG